MVEAVLIDEFGSLVNPNMDNNRVAAITAGIIAQNGYMLQAFKNWLNANIARGVITNVHPAFKNFVASPSAEDKQGALIHGLEWSDLVEHLNEAKAAFVGGQILKIQYAFSQRTWHPEYERDFGEFLAKFFGVAPSNISIVPSYAGRHDKRVEFNITNGTMSLINDAQGDLFETMGTDLEAVAQAEAQRAEDKHNILVWDGKIGFSSNHYQKLVINGLYTCVAVSVWGVGAKENFPVFVNNGPKQTLGDFQVRVSHENNSVQIEHVNVAEGARTSEDVINLRHLLQRAFGQADPGALSAWINRTGGLFQVSVFDGSGQMAQVEHGLQDRLYVNIKAMRAPPVVADIIGTHEVNRLLYPHQTARTDALLIDRLNNNHQDRNDLFDFIQKDSSLEPERLLIAEKVRNAIDSARAKDKVVVLFAAMEMPLFNRAGKKLTQVSQAGGEVNQYIWEMYRGAL